MNRYPYNAGHILIAPRRHVATLQDATAEELTEMMSLARRAEDAFREVYKPDGMNIGMNLGRPAGAGVAGHIHLPAVPRWSGATEGLWRSRDWGGSWERVQGAQGGAAPSGAVRSIHPLGPRVYVGAERQVLVSDDFGETWTAVSVPGLVLAVLPSRYPQADSTLFVGTTEGLLKSPDAGRSFDRPVLAGIPVSRLEWPGPALVVATGRGVMVSLDGGAR